MADGRRRLPRQLERGLPARRRRGRGRRRRCRRHARRRQRMVAGVSPPALGPGGCVAVRAFLVGGGSRILRRCGDVDRHRGRDRRAGAGRRDLRRVHRRRRLRRRRGRSPSPPCSTTAAPASSCRTPAASGRRSRAPAVGAAPGRRIHRAAPASGVDGRRPRRLPCQRRERPRRPLLSATVASQRVVEVGRGEPRRRHLPHRHRRLMNDGGTFAFRGDLSDGTAGVFRVDPRGRARRSSRWSREGDGVGRRRSRSRSLPSSLVAEHQRQRRRRRSAPRSPARAAARRSSWPRPAARCSVSSAARERRPPVGTLVRLRDPAIADDGSVVVPASRDRQRAVALRLSGGRDLRAGQDRRGHRHRHGRLERFRFSAAERARRARKRAVFAGSRDGIFVADPRTALETVAFVGGPDAARRHVRRLRSARCRCRGHRHLRRGHRGKRHREPRSDHRRTRVACARWRGSRSVSPVAASWSTSSRARSTRSPVPTSGRSGEMAFEATLAGEDAARAPLHGAAASRGWSCARTRPLPAAERFDTFGTPAMLRGKRMAFVAQVGPDANKKRSCSCDRGSRTRVLAAQGGGAPGRLAGRFDAVRSPRRERYAGRLPRRRSTRPATRASSWHRRARSACWSAAGDRGTGRRDVPGVLGARPWAAASAVFLARLAGSPASAAPLPCQCREPCRRPTRRRPRSQRSALPGDPSPVGGTIDAVRRRSTSNRSDALAVVADLVGASARTVLVLVDASSTVVP